MALKDWKKIIDENREEIIFTKDTHTRRADSFKVIYIYRSIFRYYYNWTVTSNLGFIKQKRFKSKASALSFAKSYMRKH